MRVTRALFGLRGDRSLAVLAQITSLYDVGISGLSYSGIGPLYVILNDQVFRLESNECQRASVQIQKPHSEPDSYLGSSLTSFPKAGTFTRSMELLSLCVTESMAGYQNVNSRIT